MKKKFVGIITAMTMLISVMPQITVNAAEEVTISNLSEFEAFRYDVNSGNTYEGKTVTLTADIDLSEICGADINGEEVSWTPVGADDYFSGTFDGNGHTINGLYINSEDIGCAGLFGFCDESSQILNLVVDGFVKAGHPSEGGWSNPPIEIGGIAGASAGKIADCHNKAAITGIGNGAFAAGICGMSLSAVIENCINTGVIVSEYESAAIVTWIGSPTTDNCYYLEGTSVDGSGAQAKTAEQFASGEVAYLLNGKSTNGWWHQNIGEDDYPVVDESHSLVFYDKERNTYYNPDEFMIEDDYIYQDTFRKTYVIGYTNNSNDDITVMVAEYSDKDVLLSIGSCKVSHVKGNYGQYAGVLTREAEHIKIFAWKNGFSGMQPACEPVTFLYDDIPISHAD